MQHNDDNRVNDAGNDEKAGEDDVDAQRTRATLIKQYGQRLKCIDWTVFPFGLETNSRSFLSILF